MKFECGFSMIEVLVSLIILAVGLLGLAGLQMNNMKYAYSAGSRAQATIMAHDMMERLRLDSSRAISGDYNSSYGATATGDSASALQLKSWKAALEDRLPGAQGSVNVMGNGSATSATATVSVKWNDARGSGASEDDAPGGLLEFSISSRLYSPL